MEAVLPIMSQFPEIETCVEVSREFEKGCVKALQRLPVSDLDPSLILSSPLSSVQPST